MRRETSEFAYMDMPYAATHDGKWCVVHDYDGCQVFKIPVPSLPSVEVLTLHLCVFQQGVEEGRKEGRLDAQNEMRKALGINF